MNNYKDVIKIFAGGSICFFWNVIGTLLPKKKNLVVFDSFVGKQYSCNPRAIYEYMLENYDSNIEYVWAFINPDDFKYLEKNRNTRVVKYHSIKHHYYFHCAETIVFNWKKTYDLPARKNQTIIQTWHGGGCYKKAGTAITENSRFHSYVMKKETNKITDYVSSSSYFSEHVIREQQEYKGNILETGMPRNDVFFHDTNEVYIKTRSSLGISADDYVVLYAPTYRDSIMDQDCEALSYQSVENIVRQKFGRNTVLLYRGHHYTKKNVDESKVKDVSDYYDMQDLLLISDMLISDYSSSIWDYSFTYRPCFLYTPDLDKYIAARGFDEDIYSWGFPVALSNDELADKILNFDENDFKSKMEDHHAGLGSFERGNATEQICNLILNRIKEKN